MNDHKRQRREHKEPGEQRDYSKNRKGQVRKEYGKEIQRKRKRDAAGDEKEKDEAACCRCQTAEP